MKWHRTHAGNRSNINNAPRTTLCHTHPNFPARYIAATLVYLDHMTTIILFKLVRKKRFLKNTSTGHQNTNWVYIFLNSHCSRFNARFVTHINLFGNYRCLNSINIHDYNLTSIICEQTDTCLYYSAGPQSQRQSDFVMILSRLTTE